MARPSPPSAAPRTAVGAERAAVGLEDRRRVAGLASLFVLDSLGGGFLAGTILSYWFFRRFALSAGAIGLIFAGGKVLNAISYFGADASGQLFAPEIDRVLIDELKSHLDPEIQIVEVDAHINTPEFGRAVALALEESLAARSSVK